MKVLTLFMTMTLGSVGLSCAQELRLESDSVEINIERAAITKELSQLRDSIKQTIKIFDSKIRKASANKKEKLESTQKDLIEYMNRVKSDLQETSLTARNAWTVDSASRIKVSTSATRREYYRIRRSSFK